MKSKIRMYCAAGLLVVSLGCKSKSTPPSLEAPAATSENEISTGRVEEKKDVSQLIQKLNNPNVPEMERHNIALELGSVSEQNPEIIKALIQAYQNKSNPLGVRKNAIGGLVRWSKDPTVRSILEDAVKDPEVEIRYTIAQEMANQINREEFAAWLTILAKDSDPDVAQQAKKGL